MLIHKESGRAGVARLRGGGYEAVIAPAFGANCLSLRHVKSGVECLRTPPSLESLAENPNVYGLPLLFPPNRLHNGTFTFEGRTYHFPVNDAAHEAHLHGFLSKTPFEETDEGVFTYRATKDAPYLSFPHAFTVTRRYALNENGLTHTISVTNDSERNMPLGVGVHAALHVEKGARLRVPVVRQWLFDPKTFVPTGETLTDSPLLSALRAGEASPEAQPLSCLLDCAREPIILQNPSYDVEFLSDARMPFLMLWNGGGGQGFVCPEPQSWLIDAPHSPLPAAETGMDALRPREMRTYTLRYRVLPR